MNNKIPCGGFYLSDTLGVDENGKLGVNGGEPYKSLVTDGEGNVKWEDRLAYETATVVLGEQTATFSDVGGTMMSEIAGSLDVVADETVTVLWDGVSYTCTAVNLNATLVAFGNFGLSGAVDHTEEPFFIMSNGSAMQVLSDDESTEHVLSIFKDYKVKKIQPKYTGLLAFSILWDGTSNYSATASYQEVRDAYDAKLPIFANLFTTDGCYPATEIAERNDTFVFRCGTYGVSYSSDGTIGKTGPT